MLIVILNLALIFIVTGIFGYRKSWLWRLLAFTVIFAIFSLSRTRMALGLPLEGGLLMPHAVVPILLVLALFLMRQRVFWGSYGFWVAFFAALTSVVANIFSFPSGEHIFWAGFSSITFLGPCLFLFLAEQLDREEKGCMLRLIATAVAVSVSTGLPLYFIDIPIVADMDIVEAGYRLTTILGNPLTQAGICLLVLPYVLTVLKVERKLCWGLLFSLTLLGIFLSGSRLIIPIAIAYMVVSVVRGLARPGQSGLSALVIVGVSVASFIFVADAAPQIFLPIERLVSETSDTIGSSLMRLESLTTGLRLIADRPVIGFGPGQIYEWSRVTNDGTSTGHLISLEQGVTLIEPHNLPIMIAVEYGMVVLAIFTIYMLMLLRRLGRPTVESSDKIAAGATVGILLFMGQSFGSSDVAIMPHIATIFWLWCGCCTGARRERQFVGLGSDERISTLGVEMSFSGRRSLGMGRDRLVEIKRETSG